ncbi:MAG: exo-alpha-sialidase [Verrucomicrobia bacterium]|nr:exo-alpha-sialidase [Verrucomicrobiota bacterium]
MPSSLPTPPATTGSASCPDSAFGGCHWPTCPFPAPSMSRRNLSPLRGGPSGRHAMIRTTGAAIRSFCPVLLILGLTISAGRLAAAGPALPPPWDLEPTAAHPRNSEGSFATLASGRIIFCFSQFDGGGDDSSPSAIAEIHSDDHGRTWSAARVVVPTGDNRNLMSASLLRLRSGALALFYLAKKNNWLDCHPFLRLSHDEGQTWGPALPITRAPGYFELNNDRVVQLRTGRLVLALSSYRVTGTVDAPESWDRRSLILWYYSDDEGRTWRESDTWWTIPVGGYSGLEEPGVVELADGTLFSWARTDQGCQFGFRSTDAGLTWSPPAPTELVSPRSPAGIKRLPGSACLLAIYNDHSGRFPFQPGKRTPLVLAYSTDGGRTWPDRQVLEDDPTGWYCYTAIHFTDEGVLLAYCASTGEQRHLSKLRLRLVPWSWLRVPPAPAKQP